MVREHLRRVLLAHKHHHLQEFFSLVWLVFLNGIVDRMPRLTQNLFRVIFEK